MKRLLTGSVLAAGLVIGGLVIGAGIAGAEDTKDMTPPVDAPADTDESGDMDEPAAPEDMPEEDKADMEEKPKG